MRRTAGWQQPFFDLESYKALVRHRAGGSPGAGSATDDIETEATVKLWFGDERVVAIGEGNGPVTPATWRCAARSVRVHLVLDRIALTDFKVRVLDTGRGTGAVTRVLLDL